MTRPSNEKHDSEANELARERNRAAADRSLLAWIRTSLALIAFGFGIDRIVNVVSPGRHDSLHYRRELRMLNEPRYTYAP